MRSRILTVVVILLGTVLFVFLRPSDDTIGVANPVPDFSLPDDAGRQVQLHDFSGKLLLLNFWSTSCQPCVAEIPSLNALAARYQARGLAIVGVNQDGAPEAMQASLRQFRARTPIDFPVLFDADGRLADRYGTFRIPETYMIDPGGRLIRKIVGAIDWLHPSVLADIERHLPH